MSRTTHPFILILCLAAIAGLGAHAPAAPNVLLLIADDLGVDFCQKPTADPVFNIVTYDPANDPNFQSPYVNSLPNISNLAANGVTFRQAWAMPACSPTRAAMFTGLFPWKNGVGYPDSADLDADHLTLAEQIPASCVAGMFGKWHLGKVEGSTTALAQGWSVHHGTLAGTISNYAGWTRSYSELDGTTPESATVGTYATKWEVDKALEWIGAADGQWFATMAFHTPHTGQSVPFHTPMDSTTYSSNSEPAGMGDDYVKFNKMVQNMDSEIGRLIDGINAAGELQDTVIIFLGDNGTDKAIAGTDDGKARARQGGVHVPLIIADGGFLTGQTPAYVLKPPNMENEKFVNVVDLYATIYEILNDEAAPASATVGGVTKTTDSVSLLQYINTTKAAELYPTVPLAPREFNFSQIYNPNNAEKRETAICMRWDPDDPRDAQAPENSDPVIKLLYDVGEPISANPPLIDPHPYTLWDVTNEGYKEHTHLQPLSPGDYPDAFARLFGELNANHQISSDETVKWPNWHTPLPDDEPFKWAAEFAATQDGKFVFVSDRYDTVTAFSRETNSASADYGALTPFAQVKDGVGGVDGIDNAQSLALSPAGDQLYVCGATDDKVAVFDFDPEARTLTFRSAYGHSSLDRPRKILVYEDRVFVSAYNYDHIVALTRDANGDLAYAAEYDDSGGVINAVHGMARSHDGNHFYATVAFEDKIVGYDYNGGNLLYRADLEVDSSNAANATKCWCFDIEISPDDKFVYVTDYDGHRVDIYSRNAADGKLTLVGYQGNETELEHPRRLTIDPSGNYVLVAALNGVVAYQRNPATGLLTKVSGVGGHATDILILDNHMYVTLKDDDAVTKYNLNVN